MTARLFTGARLLQPDPAPAEVDSMAVADGRIVAVGTAEQCRAALPSDAETVHLDGAVLAPGFVDAHLHPMVMSVFEQQLVLDSVSSVGEVLDAVRDQARRTDPSRAVIGFQLDDARLAERRLPTAEELQAAAGPGREVVLVRRDGHHAVASEAALRSVGFDRAGTVVEGGSVELDAHGVPTGLVRERAVEPLLGLMGEVTMEDLSAGAQSWSQRLLRQGVTALSAMCQTTAEGPSGGAGELEAVGWSALVDQLPFDIQTILITPDVADVDVYRSTPLHQPGAGRRLDAVKLFLDGTLGGCTACMHLPFSDHPHTNGLATIDPDVAYRRLEAAHLAGLSACVHAIGDAANARAAELFGRLLDAHPGVHRHRVEHASVLDQATVERFAELGLTAVVQPINLRSEAHWLADRVGAERLSGTYAFRSLLDAGVRVAGSSDAPIESTDVLAAMDAAAHRPTLGPDQTVSGLEALRFYTTGSSAARGTEDRLGLLAVGLRADVVVLSDDPTVVRPAEVQVQRTVIDGVDHFVAPGA